MTWQDIYLDEKEYYAVASDRPNGYYTVHATTFDNAREIARRALGDRFSALFNYMYQDRQRLFADGCLGRLSR